MAEGDVQGKPLIRYVDPNLSDGWLTVLSEHGGRFSLPSCVEVAVYREDHMRTYFTVREGLNKGVKASVMHLSGHSPLTENVIHIGPAKVRLNLLEQKLWYGTSGPFFAFSGAYTNSQGRVYTAIPAGTYSLRIPDAPHVSNRYSEYTAFQKVWFPILGRGVTPSDGRYLHVGELSDGCVTVRATVFDPKAKVQPDIFRDWANISESQLGGWGFPYPKKLPALASWDNVYRYLIISRLNDQSVGTLVVE